MIRVFSKDARRLFAFKVPRRHYKSDAFIVWCFDERFNSFHRLNPLLYTLYWILQAIGLRRFNPETSLLRAYVHHMKIKHPDVVTWGGGGKAFGDKNAQSVAGQLFAQAELSERLHGSREIHIVAAHSDCGGHGGVAAFNGDEKAEDIHHRAFIEEVVTIVSKRIPGKRIVGVYPKFDSVELVAEYTPN